MEFKTLEEYIGNTPLVRLKRLGVHTGNVMLAKLEGNNPAGSLKDRPALSMILQAERRGLIQAGDTLIEATSGNTGIALAMVAALRGYRMIVVMPEHQSTERRRVIRAFGADMVLTAKIGGMEMARDIALQLQAEGKGIILDQFSNSDNPGAHYEGTAQEIWQQSSGKLTHLVCSMGTTGTIMGCAAFFKERSPAIRIIGCQPAAGGVIPGIRHWPEAYLPAIYDRAMIDELYDIEQAEAEDMTRRLAREEGIFAGISSGGALSAALRVAEKIRDAVIVTIICDRGDRYFSTGVFPG